MKFIQSTFALTLLAGGICPKVTFGMAIKFPGCHNALAFTMPAKNQLPVYMPLFGPEYVILYLAKGNF